MPETKGVPIEEMDKIFGGNQAHEDLQRIHDIRNRLGLAAAQAATSEESLAPVKNDEKGTATIEHATDLDA